MCVCSLRYPSCNVHAPYCHLWPARLCSIFPNYLTKGMIFGEKLLNTKRVSIFSATLSEIFFILRRTERDIFIHVHRSSCICFNEIGRCMHRAPSCNMYINQQDAQNSCDWSLFFNIRSTCFGLYQSIFRSNLFVCCMSCLVYAGTIRLAVVLLQTYPHIPAFTKYEIEHIKSLLLMMD